MKATIALTPDELRGAEDPDGMSRLLARCAGASHVVLDLDALVHINSTMASTWRRFIAALERNTQVTLERCSVAFIDLVNVVPELAPLAEIRSFYLPIRCLACGKSAETMLAVSAARPPVLPACRACGKATEPEVELDGYLAFLDA